MNLTTINVGVRDDWIGTRNTELDGLMIRGDELIVWGCELLSDSIEQSAKGDLRPSSFLRCSLTLYSSFWTILILHLLVIHAYTWVHVPSTTSSTCYELQQPRWYCSRVISSLMRPNHQLWAFNVEVTASPGIAPPPCSHGWPTVLVLFLGMSWEAVFKGMPPLLLTILVGQGQDCSRQYLLAVWTLFVHPRALLPPRHGPWALYEVGRGCWVLWPHRFVFAPFFY